MPPRKPLPPEGSDEVPRARGRGDERPIPDPTFLTTKALERSIELLKELIEVKFEAVHERFLAQEKATQLLQEMSNKGPTINEVFLRHEERFDSIATQFKERDTRTEQTSKDSKVAVDAALQAAKEAVGEQNKSSALAIAKSEAATTKQMDQIGAIITANNTGINDKIDDIKSRLTIIEGTKKGGVDAWVIMVAAVTAVALLIGTATAIAALMVSLIHK